jgi:hypothetical protein
MDKMVLARVSTLPKMSLQEMKNLWQELYQEPPR